MELLYFYALAHQTSFDVRWIKSRSIQELIIQPLAAKLKRAQFPPAEEGGDPEPALRVLGGSRVTQLRLGPDGSITSLGYKAGGWGSLGVEQSIDELDGCVLALGAKGMRSVVSGSPELARAAPELCAASSLGSIDVISCRLWLDRTVATRTPANVFSRFPQLRGAGGTFFMLDQLQSDDPQLLWGDDEVQGSVVACDFYNAGALCPLADDDIVSLLMDQLLPSAIPAFRQAKIVDSHVARYPGAVSWFSPGSFPSRPPLQTSVPNLVCAGDWVRLGDRETRAKGLCQERAYISGLEAANQLARSGALGSGRRVEHPVLEIRQDEPQVVAGQAVNKLVMEALRPFGLASPWVR
jgi:uncharacterized protein with NAD-binding domain and iron-sulfur cluster